MAAAVTTFTRPTDVTGYSNGNVKTRFFDFTTDTGDYAAGGFAVTAASLGFRKIYFVTQSGGVATQGTSGASGVGVGITYTATGITIQTYETGASSGAPFSEKGAEAQVANFTIRLKVEGR